MLWRGKRTRKWKWRRRYSLQVLDILRLAEVLQVGEVADKVWVFEVFGGGEVVDVELVITFGIRTYVFVKWLSK